MIRPSKLERFSIALIVLFVLAVLAIIACGFIPAHADTSSNHKRRTQREIVSTTNPNIYLLGEFEGGKIFKYHDVMITNIVIQPWGTSQMFEGPIAFCGDLEEEFRGKSGLIVIIYSREKTQEPCYDLRSVYKVPR